MGKSYNNTPKGRSEVPAKPGAYNLRNKSGEIIYTGETENLKRRIKEHHYDKTKHFSSITITSTKTKKQAKNIETKRLRAKIIELEFKNYKVFNKLKINLDQYNVFVGPNSSGKSSIAEFLTFFREFIRQCSGKTSSLVNFKDFLSKAFSIGQDKPLFFKIKMIIGEYMYKYSANFSRELSTNTIWADESFIITNREENYQVFKSSVDFKADSPYIEGWHKWKGLDFGDSERKIDGDISYINQSMVRFLYRIVNNKGNFFYIFDQFYEYWDNIRLYDSNRYDKKKIVEFREISNDIIVSEDFQNILSVLLNIYLQQKGIFEEIGDWLKKLLINFQELKLKISDEKGKGEILFSEGDWSKSILLPIKWASDGVIRLICYLAILFNKEKPTLIMFDEPENGFHPAIRDYVVDFSITASDKSQLIYITHDSESLRYFELENIYYFKRGGRFTEVRRLSEEESLTETIKALNDIEKNTVVSTHSSNSL